MTNNQGQATEQTERFETHNAKWGKSNIISRKNEVLRFLLETAGAADELDL